MVRISVRKQQEETIVAISGRLVAADLGELEAVRRSSPTAVMLDLRDLTSVDPEGLAALRDWIRHGAKPQSSSLYVKLLLEQQPDINEPIGNADRNQ